MIEFLKKGGPQLKKAMEEAEAETQGKGNRYSATLLTRQGLFQVFYLISSLIYYYFFSTDQDDLTEIHNLELIRDLDVEKLPDVEKWGDEYIAHLHATMQEMYGEGVMAAMPEDRIKPAMQGVSFHLLLFIIRELLLPPKFE